MMRSGEWGKPISKGMWWNTWSSISYFLLLAVIITLMLTGAIGELETRDTLYGIVVALAIMMVLLLFFRLDHLIAVLIIAIHIYFDFYLGWGVVGLVVSLLLLTIFFFRRSSQHPWVMPRSLWMWFLLLIIAIFPATHGISTLDSLYYYLTVIASSFVFFCLGTTLIKNGADVQQLFKWLAHLGTGIAVIALMQAATGTLLFGSSRYDLYLTSIGNYQLWVGSGIYRIGAFFVNPDSFGGFLSLILLLPLCLFTQSASLWGKILYLVEMLILLFTVLSTYSTESWLAICGGLVCFFVLVGSHRYRILMLLIAASIGALMLILVPEQISLQIQHATAPSELALRNGAWQTGLQVIRAFPLTGLGLGRYVYIQRAEPYRVIAQYRPLDHPHDAYLELAALGGIPLAVVFVLLLLYALWQAWRNWLHADTKTRSLLAGGIASAIALSCYSISDAGWTLAPLLAIGWLVLGAISSPLLTKHLHQRTIEEQLEGRYDE
jgi:O-antigen ligase